MSEKTKKRTKKAVKAARKSTSKRVTARTSKKTARKTVSSKEKNMKLLKKLEEKVAALKAKIFGKKAPKAAATIPSAGAPVALPTGEVAVTLRRADGGKLGSGRKSQYTGRAAFPVVGQKFAINRSDSRRHKEFKTSTVTLVEPGTNSAVFQTESGSKYEVRTA